MRQVFIFIVTLLPLCGMLAQQQKEVELKEVKVEAARTVSKPDGMAIYPSEAQREHSANGYSLLAKLAMPGIKVDEAMATVAATGNRGAVVIRINGIKASREELTALNPKLVKSIDLVDNPGLRFGTDVAYVLDIKVRRAESGFTVGADLLNGLTTKRGNNIVYAGMNSGKRQLAFSYNGSYHDFKGSRYEETATYRLTDNTLRTIGRRDTEARTRNYGNTAELKYNVADSSGYVFQATLSADFNNNPGSHRRRIMTDGADVQDIRLHDSDRNMSPVADVYLSFEPGKRQTVTANMVLTGISTVKESSHNEGSPYAYKVKGETWSAVSEAIYENRLKPFTLSAGMQWSLKRIKNSYSGDVVSLNCMRSSVCYWFGEIKGKVAGLGYMAGLGVSDRHYVQGQNRLHFWLFRPKLGLSCAVSDAMRINYSFEIYQHVSNIAMISDTRIRTNSMEWTVGNPALKPNKVASHKLDVSYMRPRLSFSFNSEYRLNRDVNMTHYTRTEADEFLYTQRNQPRIDMIYGQTSTRYDIIPDVLSADMSFGMFRFFNRGDDYRHHLTFCRVSGSLQVYAGRWSFSADADNGFRFLEGEMRSTDTPASWLTASYKISSCTVSLFWQHPLHRNPQNNKTELLNRYVSKTILYHSSDLGNMVSLRVAWKLSRGRKYGEAKRTMKHKDSDTGIM